MLEIYFNNTFRMNEVEELITDSKLGILKLVEIRIQEVNASNVSKDIQSSWKFIHNYMSSNLGIIWLG